MQKLLIFFSQVFVLAFLYGQSHKDATIKKCVLHLAVDIVEELEKSNHLRFLFFFVASGMFLEGGWGASIVNYVLQKLINLKTKKYKSKKLTTTNTSIFNKGMVLSLIYG